MRYMTLLALILVAQTSFAKSLETPYLDLVVPDDYNCTSDTGRYICQGQAGQKTKDSILTMIFKRSGPQDTIPQYQEFIGRPMSRVSTSGPPALSKVELVRTIKIAGQDWVEAKHFESDLPNYYTYYWATVRSPVAMVVTYSVEKKREEARMSELVAIRNSLRTKEVAYSPVEQSAPAPTAIAPMASEPIETETRIMGQKPIVVIIGALIIFALIFVIARR